jgi:hypothetical protein
MLSGNFSENTQALNPEESSVSQWTCIRDIERKSQSVEDA